MREVLTLDHLYRIGSDEAAALLLIRQDTGDDGHDEGVFDAWLMADPKHADAWARVCSAWAYFDDASSPEFNRLREGVRDRAGRRVRATFAIAASVALVAATGVAMLLTRPNNSNSSSPLGSQVAQVEPSQAILTTRVGEHTSFQLADTSTVVLNTNSAVRVAFRAGGERRLDLLRGQAFFKVAHDTTRPFVVAVEGRTVTALGTAFEVRADAGTTRIILVEGRVSVGGTGAAPIQMRAGQQLLVGSSGAALSKADLSSVEDWQRGIVTFRKTTLMTAAAELNRYSPTKLIVDDPRLARMTVSGVFRTNDARRFARTVQQIYPVQVVAAGSEGLRFVPAKSSTP